MKSDRVRSRNTYSPRTSSRPKRSRPCIVLTIVLFLNLAVATLLWLFISHYRPKDMRCWITENRMGRCMKAELCETVLESENPEYKTNCSSASEPLLICCPVLSHTEKSHNNKSSTNKSSVLNHLNDSSSRPDDVKPLSTDSSITPHAIKPPSTELPLQTDLVDFSPELESAPVDRNVHRTKSDVNIEEAAIRIANQKCEEYGKTVIMHIKSPILIVGASENLTVNTCGIAASALVLQGEEATLNEFPHMVLIGYGETVVVWRCGGSLISERFVLSAAHCVSTNKNSIPATWAKLGDLDTSTDDDRADPETLRIVQTIVHPEYENGQVYNDIALFKLESDLVIAANIRPLCLFTSRNLPETEITATGWGYTFGAGLPRKNVKPSTQVGKKPSRPPPPSWASQLDFRISNFPSLINESGPANSKLMKTALEVVNSDDCIGLYEPNTVIPRGIDVDSQICAGDGINDTCSGDSGGPLQLKLKKPYCMYGLVGVVSFGKPCGTGYPGVYSRVSYYLPWIVKAVWPELL